MASILDRYGIKEVADVTFYAIDETGKPSVPVLYLDTLKVSTIEQTAETAEARGGKGNPMLVSWDFGKDINLSIEDALFSPKSMSIMLGDGSVNALTGNEQKILKTARARVEQIDNTNTLVFMADIPQGGSGAVRKQVHSDGANIWLASDVDNKTPLTYFAIEGLYAANALNGDDEAIKLASAAVGDVVLVKYNQSIKGNKIVISADSFPGTYYVTGDTYARSDINGEDEFFRFIVPKAKMQSENTITLEAEGDPSVFNMSLRVLRPEDGEMMQLIQYSLDETAINDENVENG